MENLLLQADFLGDVAEFGIWVFIIIGLFILFALIDVWRTHMNSAMKLVWTAVIFFLPIIGSIIWWVWGKRHSSTRYGHSHV